METMAIIEWKDLGKIGGKTVCRAVDEKRGIDFFTRHDNGNTVEFEIRNNRTQNSVRAVRNAETWVFQHIDEDGKVSGASWDKADFLLKQMEIAIAEAKVKHAYNINDKLTNLLNRSLKPIVLEKWRGEYVEKARKGRKVKA